MRHFGTNSNIICGTVIAYNAAILGIGVMISRFVPSPNLILSLLKLLHLTLHRNLELRIELLAELLLLLDPFFVVLQLFRLLGQGG